MPGLNRRGPVGMGPMTGWGQGYCNPSRSSYGPAPGWGAGYARGFKCGRGFRRGQGRGFNRGFDQGGGNPYMGGAYAPAYEPVYGDPYGMSPEDEVNMLKRDAAFISNELDAVKRRIEELEKESNEK